MDYIKVNWLRRLIVFIVVIAFLFPILSPNSFAATSLSIKGGDSVKGGETFTVTVTYSGNSVGRVSANLTYDTNSLTYISGGSSSGNTGYVQLSNGGTGEDITFKLKFQALKDGSTTVNVTTYEMYDLNEQALDTPSASKSISISGDASDSEKITEATEAGPEDATVDEGVDEMDSDDAGVSTNMVLIISACIALALICIIIAVLVSKRKRNR